MNGRLYNLLARVMAKRVNAMMFVVLLSIMPLMGMVVNAVVSLAVLRMGVFEGAVMFVCALLSMAIASSLGLGAGILKLKVAVLIACFLVAWFLRQSRSLFRSIVFACVLGASCVYAWVDGPWFGGDGLTGYFPDQAELSEMTQKTELTGDDSSFAQRLNEQLSDPEVVRAQMIQGLLIIFLGYVLGALFLGRWFQAILYNSGGFQSEFHSLRCDKYWVGMLALVPIMLELTLNQGATLWVLALQIPLLLLGVSFVHFWAKQKQWVNGWLALFYLTLPVTYLFVVILGVADGFFSLKRNLIVKGEE